MFFVVPFIQRRILGRQNDENDAHPPQEANRNERVPQATTNSSAPAHNNKVGAGILIRTLSRGDPSFSKHPKLNDFVKVHVEIFLNDKTKVDSTRDRNQPLVFQVGAKEVIEGLEVAIQKVCVTQRVEVIIPHLYAYGDEGKLPEIPPKSTLVAHLELLEIIPKENFQ
eukprot:scaffold5088_cov98-Cylindrotheca_fusiformis.AAC.10